MEFIENYPITDLNPADYNPRLIDEESFGLLRQSLEKFGVIKPVLLGGNRTMIAGHQRTKALKANQKTQVPVMIIDNVVLKDEARLNLYHNSVETNTAKVAIDGDLTGGYQFIEPKRIKIVEKGNPAILSEICRLITKYGEWGSLIVRASGEVLFNSDYAAASFLLRQKVLIYVLPPEIEQEIMPYLSREYGVYNYDTLNLHNMSQTKCQMHRLRNGKKGKQNRSTCYEYLVLERITPEQRGIDFGEGYGDYRRKLQSEGYRIIGYEPFKRSLGSNDIVIPKIVADIKRLKKEIAENGLFDYVVLDSVINSVKNLEYEHFVLTSCNALLKSDGVFYTATRLLQDKIEKTKHVSTRKQRVIEFLDENNFSVIFRDGLWTAQRFHTAESLEEKLSRYFHDVEILPILENRKNQLRAVCRRPKQLSDKDYLKSLEAEFNPDYNGFRHSKHAQLLEQIMVELTRRFN